MWWMLHAHLVLRYEDENRKWCAFAGVSEPRTGLDITPDLPRPETRTFYESQLEVKLLMDYRFKVIAVLMKSNI